METKAGNPVVNYFKGSFQEMKKVTWPTKDKTMKITFIVFGFCIGMALYTGLLDTAFHAGYNWLLSIAR